MEGSLKYKKGDFVVFDFPFSDSNKSKKRPALVVANTYDENLILCQITSQNRPDPDSIKLMDNDFQEGSLKQTSYIRPTIIFSMDRKRVNYKIGYLNKQKIAEIEKIFCKIFKR